MSDAINLLRMLCLAAAFWNVIACAPAFWSFSSEQSASNWVRAVIFVTALGILLFQTLFLFTNTPDMPSIQKLVSLAVTSCGMLLGVYGHQLGIIDQFDKIDEAMQHPSSVFAMADLAKVDPEAAECFAAAARKLTAKAYYNENDASALGENGHVCSNAPQTELGQYRDD